jgi:CO dehydrogenase maturation factor
MGAMIAICGKGGVGKTTTAALIARLRADPSTEAQGQARTLVIDGDPASGLSLALGIKPRTTLDDLRRTIITELSGGAPDGVDLAAEADYRLLEGLVERGPLAFLSVGRPEEAGCYCKLNTFLREAIEALSARFDLVLVDAEAGIEQVNRRVMRSVDRLLLVSDGSIKGLRVAEAIAAVACEHSERGLEVGLVINRTPADAAAPAPETHLQLVATLPEDPVVTRFDAQARPFFELPDCPALQAVATQVLPWVLGHSTP